MSQTKRSMLQMIEHKLDQIGVWAHRIESKLDKVITNQEAIMATQQELVTQVNAANDKLKKIEGETRSLLTQIDALETQINNLPNVTPELQAAVDALTAQADVVDNLVPDAPPTPPTPPAPPS